MPTPHPRRMPDYLQWGEGVRLSVPTPDHFLPLLYVAGTLQEDERLSIAVEGIQLGAISMLSAVVSAH